MGADLAAADVLRAGSGLDGQELGQHAFPALAHHEEASRILSLDALSRGATGKFRRIGLAERLAVALRPTQEPTIGELDDLVAPIIAEMLDLNPPAHG